MGRRSSSSSSRSAPAPSRKAPPPAAPQRAAPPAMVAPQQSSGGGMMSGIGSTIVQGFAFGTGSALAREAVGSIFGGSSSHQSAPAQAAPAPQPVVSAVPQACEYDHKAFVSCLQQNPSNATACDHYFTALQACQARM